MDSAHIYKKIKAKEFRTEDVKAAFQNTKRKFISPVWNNFRAIFNDKDELIATHVVCKLCDSVYTYKVDNNGTETLKKETGTTNLLRHLKVCRSKTKKPTKEKGTFSFLNVPSSTDIQITVIIVQCSVQ